MFLGNSTPVRRPMDRNLVLFELSFCTYRKLSAERAVVDLQK